MEVYWKSVANSDENNCINDPWLGEFYFGYGHDAIEEDALYEKSCVQVLRILTNKADEEIMELEEDVLILKSKLTWGDKDWSDLCSATLKEKIDHLDISILSMQEEIAGNEHFFGLELLNNRKRAERLHDILKPIWDNCYLLIQNQAEISIIRKSIQPSDELEARKSLALMRKDECQGPSTDPETWRIKRPNKEQDAVNPIVNGQSGPKKLSASDKEKNAGNSIANAHTHATEKNMNQLNGQSGTQKPSSAPHRNALVKDSNASICEEPAGSKGRKRKREIDMEVSLNENDIQHNLADAGKVLISIPDSPRMGTKKNMNQLNGQSERKKPSYVPGAVRKRTKPSKEDENALVKDLCASTCEETAGSKGRKTKREIDIEVRLDENVVQHNLADSGKVLISIPDSPGLGTKLAERVQPAGTILDSKLDNAKQGTEDSIRVYKARRQEVADTKKIGSKTQLQGERKWTKVYGTKIPEARSTEAEPTISGMLLELAERKRKCASKPMMNIKQKPQTKEVVKAKEVVVSLPMSNPLKEPEVLTERSGLELVIFQEPCLAKEIDLESSSTDKFKSKQQIGISKSIASNQLEVKVKQKPQSREVVKVKEVVVNLPKSNSPKEPEVHTEMNCPELVIFQEPSLAKDRYLKSSSVDKFKSEQQHGISKSTSSQLAVKVKQKPQAKEVVKLEKVVVNPSKPDSLKEAEVQTELNCRELVIFQEPCLAKDRDFKSSSVDKFKSKQQIGISKSIASSQFGVKVKQKPQAKEVVKATEVVVKLPKCNSLKEPKVQTEMNCRELVIFQKPCLAKDRDLKSSSADKFKSKQIGISRSIASNQLGFCSDARNCSGSQIEKKNQLSSSSQVENKDLSIVPYKLETLHDYKPGRKMVGQYVKSLSNLPAKNLTVKDLRVIASRQNLRGYCKLRKAELLKVLGL